MVCEDPVAATELLAEEIRATRGSLARVAHRHDCSRRTVARWIHRLGLWEVVWAERRRVGNVRWTPVVATR